MKALIYKPLTPKDWQKVAAEKATVKTQGGMPVSIFTTQAVGGQPIVGQIAKSIYIERWNADGSFGESKPEASEYDLVIVPNPPKVISVLNVYPDHRLVGKFETIEMANENAGFGRIGIITLTEDMIQPC